MSRLSEIARLEEVGHRTWPALEDEIVHGWRARAAEGVTRRSNSITVDCEPDVPIADAVDAGIAWLAGRRLPPIFRVTDLAPPRLAAELRARRLERVDGASIMTRPLDEPVAADSRVEISPTRSEEWSDVLAGQADRSGRAGEVVSQLLDSHVLPTGFATVRDQGRPAAVGMMVVAGEFVGIFNMRTATWARRRGLAGAILRTLVARAQHQGATTAFIQVHPKNEAALALYQSNGFVHRYDYWYWQLPA